MTEVRMNQEAAQQPESSIVITQGLRLAQECAQQLSSVTGYKALLRCFAELLQSYVGAQTLTCARIGHNGAGLTLKRRSLHDAGGRGLKPHTEVQLEGIRRALDHCDRSLSLFREGYHYFQCEGQHYNLAVVDDPASPEGTLIIWQTNETSVQKLSAEFSSVFVEMLVGQLHSECRWFKKLDKTQALLYKDDLTDLFNYRYLELALDTELRRAERFNSQFCMLFIDLDSFKPINDQHGHLSGSAVLRQVADVLREAVREVDIPIRYGGDEFVIVLLGASCAKGVLVAERVRRLIEAKDFRLEDGGRAKLTASLGVAAFPEHGRDRETLLRKADETMYDSKRNGKNRVTVVGSKSL